MSEYINDIGLRAKKSTKQLKVLSSDCKNSVLNACAEALVKEAEDIIEANKIDVDKAKANGMSEGLLDRLTLTEARVKGMADGLRSIALLKDPVGEVLSMTNRPNGLMIGKKRVPLGVITVIYESRPNVTADSFGLTFKSGNAVILRGGSDSINSNMAIAKVIRGVLSEKQINPDCIILLDKTDREYVNELMKLNQYVDVIIPRGGSGLIQNVVNNSTVQVIQTGVGNCHVFVDKSADFDIALNIIENAKTQRLGVCNACESLVVHEEIADRFLPLLYDMLYVKHGVEIRGDEIACSILPGITKASDDDFYTEYLAKIISLKIVSHFDDAIDWINEHSTGHSESIVSQSYNNVMRFHNEIDSAAVYANASTRFTDGGEFGLGAEIGISTQKLHARGPLGLEELTTIKYIIFGNGQIR